MDLSVFNSTFNKEFRKNFAENKKLKVKDGFFYYKIVELIEKNRKDVVLFFERKVSYETFRDEILELVSRNRDFFSNSFPEVNFEDRGCLTVYAWVKTRIEYAQYVVDKIKTKEKMKQKKIRRND